MSVDWDKAPDWADRAIRRSDRFEWIFGNDEKFQAVGGKIVNYGEGDYYSLDEFVFMEMRPDAWKEGEERMNNIAQNGNDGHYEDSGTVDSTLEERGNRYGEFSDVAATTQNIKSVMHNGVSCEALTPVQWEALSMIASKIARIVNGDPDYADNWHDIAGYARLVEKELEK